MTYLAVSTGFNRLCSPLLEIFYILPPKPTWPGLPEPTTSSPILDLVSFYVAVTEQPEKARW